MQLLPESGFFMNATNAGGSEFVYGDAIRYMANMMNSSHGVNEKCVQEANALNGGDWCVMTVALSALNGPL